MSEEIAYYDRVMDYHATFSAGRGRNVLNDLRAQYQRRSSFVPGDPQATAFREGQRDVVLAIEAMLATAEDKEFTPQSVREYFNTTEEENADGY